MKLYQSRAALNSLSVSMKLKMKRMTRDQIGMKVREHRLKTEDPGLDLGWKSESSPTAREK